MRIYHQHTPPLYNLSQVTAPVNLLWANNDWLADPIVSTEYIFQIVLTFSFFHQKLDKCNPVAMTEYEVFYPKLHILEADPFFNNKPFRWPVMIFYLILYGEKLKTFTIKYLKRWMVFKKYH